MSELYTVGTTVDEVIDALADFVQPFCLESEIIRGQANRTPMPLGQFVTLTELLTQPLNRPGTAFNGVDSEVTLRTLMRIDVQADFYGDFSADRCIAVAAVLQSGYACSQFPPEIQPLYCTDPAQALVISGEEQYLSRWIITVSLNYLPAVVTPIQSATALGPAVLITADLIP